MPYSFPNQRIIKIHREPIKQDFLGIKNDNWQAASRILGPHGLRLYLYLSANKDNFTLNLSPAAIEQAIGMPRSTYHDQFRKLLSVGYINAMGGNQYEFFERPRVVMYIPENDAMKTEEEKKPADNKEKKEEPPSATHTSKDYTAPKFKF